MKKSLKQLIKATEGMSPVQFEAYCEANKIFIEWLDVTITDFNDGWYNVILPYYNDANVTAFDGSAIKISV
jgi:hypothetical protein